MGRRNQWNSLPHAPVFVARQLLKALPDVLAMLPPGQVRAVEQVGSLV